MYDGGSGRRDRWQRLTELTKVITWENGSWEQDFRSQAWRGGSARGGAPCHEVWEPKRGKEGSLVSRRSSSLRRVSTQRRPGLECQDSSGVKTVLKLGPDLSRGKERICVGEGLVLEPKRSAKNIWRTVPYRVSARAGGKVPWREAGRVQAAGRDVSGRRQRQHVHT